MNYQDKYIKYKNKYMELKNLINQKGGNGIILQTLFTSIEEYSKCQFHDLTKKNMLTDKIKRLAEVENASIISVRGDGFCMLYAVCTSILISYIENYNIATVTGLLSKSLNKCDKEEFIKPEDGIILNESISEYTQDIIRRVGDNFVDLSDAIISKKATIFGLEKADLVPELGFAEIFRKELPVYQFQQLGQILSTILKCVIINIDATGNKTNLNGVFPDGEFISKSDLSDEQIISNVTSGEWKVVYIYNMASHYYSFIPELGPDSKDIPIRDLSVEYLRRIIGKVEWF